VLVNSINGAKRNNAKPTTSAHPLRRISQGAYHVTIHQTTQESLQSFLLQTEKNDYAETLLGWSKGKYSKLECSYDCMNDLLAVELGHRFPRPWLHENLDCADQEASRRESVRNYSVLSPFNPTIRRYARCRPISWY
jgi:hypothetical protein